MKSIAREYILKLSKLPPNGRTIHEKSQIIQVFYSTLDNSFDVEVFNRAIKKAQKLIKSAKIDKFVSFDTSPNK